MVIRQELRYHSNSYAPKKKPKNGKITDLEKEYNKALVKERIIIEPINSKLKKFKILSCEYRNRRRRYGDLGIGIATFKKLLYLNQVKENLFSIIKIEIVCAA